jgi:pyridinium-3,5-bisthiocarboxylic acid mononucleotide nickel chelatase
MKKNRPGTLVTVVCRPDDRRRLSDLVFRQTTTIGIRHHAMARECLDRATVPLATPWGDVRMKVASRDGDVLNVQPEFDDVARLAAEHDVPIKEVHAQATRAWLDRSK